MDLQVLRFFIVSADAGSFSSASNLLHYAQSNLSTRIRALETELGEPLFYRDKRGLTLTSKGKLFYDYAAKILHLSEETSIALHNMDCPCGTLTLGSLEATALKDLPFLMTRYHCQCPDVKLSLRTDMNDVFQPLVLDRALDGAFVSGPVLHPDLSQVLFRKERLILVGSAEKEVSPEFDPLSQAPLITFPVGSVFRRRLNFLLSSRNLSWDDRLIELNSLGAMIANICAGIAYGYLPESIVQPYFNQGLIRHYPLEDPYSSLDVVFIHRKDHILDAAFRQFLQMIQETSGLLPEAAEEGAL